MAIADNTPKTSSPLLIAAAWILVILPTAWGFGNTVQSAMKLFTSPTTTATPPK